MSQRSGLVVWSYRLIIIRVVMHERRCEDEQGLLVRVGGGSEVCPDKQAAVKASAP